MNFLKGLVFPSETHLTEVEKLKQSFAHISQTFERKKSSWGTKDGSLVRFVEELHQCQIQIGQIKAVLVDRQEKEMFTVFSQKLEEFSSKIQSCQPVTTYQRTGLEDIADQFGRHQQLAALEGFSNFINSHPELENSTYRSLWELKGCPVAGHQSPEEIGKKCFFNLENHSCLDSERREAILSTVQPIAKRLNNVLQALEANQFEKAINAFKMIEDVHPIFAEKIFDYVFDGYERQYLPSHPEFRCSNFGRRAFYKIHPSKEFKYDLNIMVQAVQKVLPDIDKIIGDRGLLVKESYIRRDQRCKEVAHETLDILKTGKYTTPSGQMQSIKDAMNHAIANTHIYTDGGNPKSKPPRYETSPLFEVRDQNCIAVACDLCLHGSHPIVLNFANPEDCGGAYLLGEGTQEEELFRCTTIAAALDNGQGHQKQTFYPLDTYAGKTGGIYTPRVTLFRMGGEWDYQFLEKPVEIALATFAALNHPDLDYSDKDNPRLKGEELRLTREKIRSLLKMAYENKHDTLILGAFGCGDFRNPPKHMAEIFMELLTQEYSQCFRHILFAIKEDDNKGKKHNPHGNFRPFAEVIQQYQTDRSK